MSKQSTFVYTSIQKEGYHAFPEAANLPEFATGDEYDVSNLAFRHNHIFLIKVWVEVTHTNRDIEFFQMRRFLLKHFGEKTIEFGSKSCEMIAADLVLVLRDKYPAAKIKIDVAEDSINGAYLEFDPEV